MSVPNTRPTFTPDTRTSDPAPTEPVLSNRADNVTPPGRDCPVFTRA